MNTRKRLFVVVVDDLNDARIIVRDAAQQLSDEHQWELDFLEFSEPQAVKIVPGDRPDIVVMDFQSNQGPNGWEAAREIHDRTGADVIIFTGSPDRALKNAADKPVPGAIIVAKPSPRYQIKDRLSEVIRRRDSEAAHSFFEHYDSDEFRRKATSHFGDARRSASKDGKA